jgi:RimJ/RimL family protein N-acetyltransferase
VPALKPPARIVGDGVVLRDLRDDDAAAYAAAFVDDPELAALIGAEQGADENRVREALAREPRLRAKGSWLEWAVADPDTDAFLGSICLHHVEWRHRRAELGYWLVPLARGRGAGRAALAAAVDWAFRSLELERLEIMTTPLNAAAIALPERLGFVREGLLRSRDFERGYRVDLVVLGLLRADWPPG